MTEPQSVQSNVETDDLSVSRLLAIGLTTRLLLDTGIQLFFPFLPTIADGLNTTAVVLGRLVSVRSSTGLLSPLFGVLADRRGYRPVMRLGLLLAGIGYLLVGVSSNLWTAAVGMFLAGVGTFAFVPTIQAYLSARLPYHRRARGIGVLEYAWALAGILGLSLIGLLIEATSWRVPLYLIGGGLLATAVLYSALPSAQTQPVQTASRSTQTRFSPRRLRAFFQLGSNQRSAWMVIAGQGLIMGAAMHLFINYGSWLEADYALSPGALGRVALILGVADLGGSGLVSLAVDWFGKRRSVFVGTAVAAAGFLLLPWLNTSLATAVVGLVLVRFAFEFSVVSNMALLSEQSPTMRGKLMTLGAASALLGSTIAGLTGPLAFARFDLWGLSLAPAALMLLVTLLYGRFVTEQS